MLNKSPEKHVFKLNCKLTFSFLLTFFWGSAGFKGVGFHFFFALAFVTNVTSSDNILNTSTV